MKKRWIVKNTVNPVIKDQFPEMNPLVLQLLYNREITSPQAIETFITPEFTKDLNDPFLFSQMEKAATRILQAIEKNEKIAVYGDYDADGVTSTGVMKEVLTALGADITVYIPFRETEGYGLNEKAVNELADQQISLIITVDCGISNIKETEILKQRGVDVIITDHHLPPPEIPNAYAIINPNVENEPYPFKYLAGCGVAFKVAQALFIKQHDYKVTHMHEGWEKWLLDLVAIGTVADMQPLLGENRVLVKYGLLVLNKTRRIGLKKLITSLGNKTATLDEKTIGWQIAPRLNAAGRIDHANTAYELLVTEDEQTAQWLCDQLNAANQERQRITERLRKESEALITADIGNKHMLVAIGTDWPTGMVGLVAGKISDTYHLPTMVISKVNGEIIGSGRSIEEFNIVKALQQCQNFLAKYGGHSGACGFTVKNEQSLQLFVEKMQTLAGGELSGREISPVLTIDAEVRLTDVNWELYEDLSKFMPFGEGNPVPMFVVRKARVVSFQVLGKDKKHLRLMVQNNGTVKKFMNFGQGNLFSELKAGALVDIVFQVGVNEWNGTRELQFTIVDLHVIK